MARPSTEILVTDLGDLDCIPMSFNEDLLLSDFLDYDGLELDPLLDLPISLENESRGGAKSTAQAANARLPRSHRLRISEEQKRHLTDWTSLNPEPYPTKEEKADLSELTGMTVAQVSSWFSRLRQRKLQRVNQPISSSPLVPDVESRAEPPLDLHARPKSFSFDDDHGADHRLFLQTGSLDISILHHSDDDDNREPFLRASSLPAAITLHHLRCFSSIPLNKQDGPLSLEAVASLHGEPDSRLKETTEAHSSFPSHLPRLALPAMLSKTSYVENWIRNIGCSHPSPANDSNVQPNSVQVPLTAGVRDLDVQGDQSSTTSGTADDNIMERHFSRSPLEAPVGVSDHGSNAGTTSDYASSHGSAGSASSYISLGPRQGRRVAFVDQSTTPLKRKASEDAAKQPSAKRRKKTTTPTVKWVCSFCQRVFSTRFTWQRHEKSAHLTPDRWICGYSLWEDASLDCPICATGGIRQPLGSCGHRFPECLRRPEGARTFYRRDALTQHLKVFHCKDQKWPQQIAPLHLDEWVIHSEPALAALVCPFCGFQAPNWEARVKHIAKHYESGLNLAVPVSSGPGSFIQSIDTHPLTKRLLEDSLICRRGKKLQDYRRLQEPRLGRPFHDLPALQHHLPGEEDTLPTLPVTPHGDYHRARRRLSQEWTAVFAL
ncbi:hypothetical protein PG991_016257 [Apiospora marii]|uniref:Homeobox domain-containing protein n=1 Tax=Apiospora marii TaxID=335849 RepID=A0ABR1R1F1_9PEZI